MINDNHIKIFFSFYDEDTEEHVTEGVWAVPQEKNYKIDNIPFYAYLYSADDIVSVREEDGILTIEGLVKPSGNSTIRILFDNEIELYKLKRELDLLGCDSEVGRSNKLLAVNIPKSIPYTKIIAYLNIYQNIQFEEASISEYHRNEI